MVGFFCALSQNGGWDPSLTANPPAAAAGTTHRMRSPYFSIACSFNVRPKPDATHSESIPVRMAVEGFDESNMSRMSHYITPNPLPLIK